MKHLAQKIHKIMAVNYCGHQLARRLEGTAPHPGVCKHSQQYDGRPDGRFWTLNLGNVSGMGGNVSEELRKRMIDVCCP